MLVSFPELNTTSQHHPCIPSPLTFSTSTLFVGLPVTGTIPSRAPGTSRIGCVRLRQALSETGGVPSRVRKSECVGMKYGVRVLISLCRHKQEISKSTSYALGAGAIPSSCTSRDIITAQGCMCRCHVMRLSCLTYSFSQPYQTLPRDCPSKAIHSPAHRHTLRPQGLHNGMMCATVHASRRCHFSTL